MDIRSLLVPLSGVDDDARLLDLAIGLGRRFGAEVQVLFAGVDPRDAVAFVGEGMSAGMIEQLVDAAARDGRARGERARAAFATARDAVGANGPAMRLIERTGPEDDVIAELGRLADLILLTRRNDDDGSNPSFQAALKDTGRPVVVVPPGFTDAAFGRRVAIAWNAAIEASRALIVAMPFLTRAESVEVLTVVEGAAPAPSGADVVAYLALHGVKATARDLACAGAHPGKLVLKHAAGADFLVTGAYSRSHMRRLIYGGVTAEILAAAPMPAMMVH